MSERDRFPLAQLLALCSVAALTPALRLLPRLSASIAGRGGWLSVLLALPAAAAYGLFLWRFSLRRRPGESLPALWRRAAGERVGGAALALMGLWLLFYAAFTLRDSAARLIETVYPHADRRIFILPLGALSAVAGAGEARRLTRTAQPVLPLLVLTVALSLVFALPELRAENLLPVFSSGAGALLCGAWPTLDAAALVLTLLFFLSDRLTGLPRYRSVAARIGLLGALMAALVASVTGAFGHELAARLARPFFSLVRSLVFFRRLERLEALPAALWVFSDFLLVSALLLIARRCLAALVGERPWLPWAIGAAAVGLALVLAPGEAAFARLGSVWVPLANAAICLLLIPGVYAAGRIRRTL